MACFDAAAVDTWAAAATATDNCDANVTVTHTYTMPTAGCDQLITVTFSATDACGNTGTATATFAVDDNVAPVVTAPTAPLAMACFDAAAVDTWAAAATATDNCDATVTVTHTYTMPTAGCDQVITVTFSATDACGNTGTATATFAVDDNVAPVVTAPTAPLAMACFDAAAVDSLGCRCYCYR